MSDFRRILSSAVGKPESASDDELARGLAEMIRPGSNTEPALVDEPQGTSKFVDSLGKPFYGS